MSYFFQSYFEAKFGEGCVEVLKDSNSVNRSNLEEGKAYLQVTFVEPYFDELEIRRRPLEFYRNYAVNRFIHSTPFTLDGHVHGTLAEQYKRKTILTTARYFPYIKTRLPVVSRENFVLCPVEVALEDVQRRLDQLNTALANQPPDAKFLQMVLQMTIG
ncbi:unnamed protein product [Protopolystoma xenopodis]|uniref:DOCKER domain-containing protein n=1 Tax=Protopolystoma xenopodis TaxID=117903 RepID=A0A448WGZ6_9PLAT|nr:unnamed protein product [Protopolystoma xenopodis]